MVNDFVCVCVCIWAVAPTHCICECSLSVSSGDTAVPLARCVPTKLCREMIICSVLSNITIWIHHPTTETEAVIQSASNHPTGHKKLLSNTRQNTMPNVHYAWRWRRRTKAQNKNDREQIKGTYSQQNSKTHTRARTHTHTHTLTRKPNLTIASQSTEYKVQYSIKNETKIQHKRRS